MEQRISTREDYLKLNIVIEYINAHLDENIDLEHLAEVSNFSKWHFQRMMKAWLGEPVGAYIMRVRLETAAKLLRYSEMSVSEIAYRVGYDTPSSLSKVFRMFYSISPSEYRNNKNYKYSGRKVEDGNLCAGRVSGQQGIILFVETDKIHFLIVSFPAKKSATVWKAMYVLKPPTRYKE